MRLRSLVPCAAVVAVLGLPAAPANAAATKRCTERDGLFVEYRVVRGPARSVTCSSAFAVLFKGILEQRTAAGWRCRFPKAAAWPVVQTCERRTRGRRTATAELHVVDGFYEGG